jgi:uncharacterized protein YjlB
MSLIDDLKRVAEKAIAWGSSEDPKKRVRQRKARTYKFKDDGLIPNHPRWPFLIYKGAVQVSGSPDPAAIFEELFESNDWVDTWRDGIYDWVHYHSRTHEVLGIARGTGRVRFGEVRVNKLA